MSEVRSKGLRKISFRHGKSKAKKLTTADVSDGERIMTAKALKKRDSKKSLMPFQSKMKVLKVLGTEAKTSVKSPMKRLRQTIIPRKIRKSVSKRLFRNSKKGTLLPTASDTLSGSDEANSMTSLLLLIEGSSTDSFDTPSSPQTDTSQLTSSTTDSTLLTTKGSNASVPISSTLDSGVLDSTGGPSSKPSGVSEKSTLSSTNPIPSPTVKSITDEINLNHFGILVIPNSPLTDGSYSASFTVDPKLSPTVRSSTDVSTSNTLFGSNDVPISSLVQVSVENEVLEHSISAMKGESAYGTSYDTNQNIFPTSAFPVVEVSYDENDVQEISSTPTNIVSLPVMEIELDIDEISISNHGPTIKRSFSKTSDGDEDSCLSHDNYDSCNLSDLESQASSIFVAKDDTDSIVISMRSVHVPIDKMQLQETISRPEVKASMEDSQATSFFVAKKDVNSITSSMSSVCVSLEQVEIRETLSRLVVKASMEETTSKIDTSSTDMHFHPVVNCDSNFKEGSSTKHTWFQHILVCCIGGDEAQKQGVIG